MEKTLEKKKIPFLPQIIISGVSALLLIVFVIVARFLPPVGVVRYLYYYLVPILCFQFCLFGFHILLNVKSKLKWLGLIGVFGGLICYALVASLTTDDNRILIHLLMQLAPITGDGTSLTIPFTLIFDGSLYGLPIWEVAMAGMNVMIIYGTIAYFAIPKKLFGLEIKRYGLARYLIALFIVPLIALVAIVVVIWLGLLLLGTLLGGSSSTSTTSSRSTSTSSSTQETSTSDEKEDTRINKKIILEGARSVVADNNSDPHYLTDIDSGNKMQVYNYHLSTGYLEDENRNIYYFNNSREYDNFKVTKMYRYRDESDYDADRRVK